ncbi:MAG TPA: PilZ domain-containing protein [Elusimicrobiota bacterium]|nr:PilZ domain-containing protein [Elusimicrobiota bacterium]
MTESSGPEKRGAPRAATDFVVELYELDNRTLIGIGRLQNLSVSGACVESVSVLAEKTGVVVRLLLGKRHLLTLPADVVWVRNLPNTRQYGIRFGGYPEGARQLVVKFVEEYFSELKGTDFLANPPGNY